MSQLNRPGLSVRCATGGDATHAICTVGDDRAALFGIIGSLAEVRVDDEDEDSEPVARVTPIGSVTVDDGLEEVKIVDDIGSNEDWTSQLKLRHFVPGWKGMEPKINVLLALADPLGPGVSRTQFQDIVRRIRRAYGFSRIKRWRAFNSRLGLDVWTWFGHLLCFLIDARSLGANLDTVTEAQPGSQRTRGEEENLTHSPEIIGAEEAFKLSRRRTGPCAEPIPIVYDPSLRQTGGYLDSIPRYSSVFSRQTSYGVASGSYGGDPMPDITAVGLEFSRSTRPNVSGGWSHEATESGCLLLSFKALVAHISHFYCEQALAWFLVIARLSAVINSLLRGHRDRRVRATPVSVVPCKPSFSQQNSQETYEYIIKYYPYPRRIKWLNMLTGTEFNKEDIAHLIIKRLHIVGSSDHSCRGVIVHEWVVSSCPPEPANNDLVKLFQQRLNISDHRTPESVKSFPIHGPTSTIRTKHSKTNGFFIGRPYCMGGIDVF
ncbi:hypothetical protein FA13DRAFT_1711725 [Coprinellus micaceus]|uniref:Uncharacterized protein n=1 Tax=Coprinellus micaceus TaxID=71717 RepID=A0A4Y7T560_COPMI|nr:hypothetical protein FA13DRAFT_1711725 [Coprinellus micaceus]